MTMAIQEYAGRAKRAAEADGLNDILSGVIFLAITLMEYTNQRLLATIHGHNFTETADYKRELTFFLLMIVALFVIRLFATRGIKTLRERFVYARLGYAAPQTSPSLRRKLMMVAVCVGITFLVPAVVRPFLEAGKPVPFFNTGMIVAILGIMYAAYYFVQYAKLGFTRYLVLGGIAAAAGIVLSMARLDDLPAMGSLVVILAVSMIVAGSVTFAHLLQTPVISETETEPVTEDDAL